MNQENAKVYILDFECLVSSLDVIVEPRPESVRADHLSTVESPLKLLQGCNDVTVTVYGYVHLDLDSPQLLRTDDGQRQYRGQNEDAFGERAVLVVSRLAPLVVMGDSARALHDEGASTRVTRGGQAGEHCEVAIHLES